MSVLPVAPPFDPILESYEAVAYESKAIPLAEPDVMAAGRDQQIEAAVKELMKKK